MDRIGIISDISKEINKLSGNIETSKMVKLGRAFNMLLLISIKQENIKLLENKLLSYNDLSVTLKQTTNEKPANNIYLFILKGADNEGIVHMFTQLFSKYNISIIDVETKLLNAPTTGSPLFYMKLILERWNQFVNEAETGDVVRQAFENTDPDYLASSVAQRNPGPQAAGSTFSSPTTPDDLVQGVLDGLGDSVPNIDRIIHGTTIATNAILQRRGATVALITTQGIRDQIEIGDTPYIPVSTPNNYYFSGIFPTKQGILSKQLALPIQSEYDIQWKVNEGELMPKVASLRNISASILVKNNCYESLMNDFKSLITCVPFESH